MTAEGGAVLLVTGRRAVVDAVLPLAAAVGVDVEVREDVESAGALWSASPLVLAGDDTATRGVATRRPGVVVVGAAPAAGSPVGGERFWRAAVEVGAEDALVLPQDQERLLQRFTVLTDPDGGGAVVVSVLGGRGGAGASTLAATLAVTAARAHRTLLVDADPWGAGLDALLGSETAVGMRWPDLAGLDGPVRGASLRAALPRPHGASLLSWGCGPSSEPPPAAVESVLDAGRRHFGAVVVDLPHAPGPVSLAALSRSDVLVLLVPAEVRAALAAARVAAAVRVSTDVRLVVRGPSPAGLDADQVADALGLPLAASLPAEPRLAAALERGGLPRPRGPLARWCARFLADLGAGGLALREARRETVGLSPERS